jgi:hypothetical protein
MFMSFEIEAICRKMLNGNLLQNFKFEESIKEMD